MHKMRWQKVPKNVVTEILSGGKNIKAESRKSRTPLPSADNQEVAPDSWEVATDSNAIETDGSAIATDCCAIEPNRPSIEIAKLKTPLTAEQKFPTLSKLRNAGMRTPVTTEKSLQRPGLDRFYLLKWVPDLLLPLDLLCALRGSLSGVTTEST